MHRNTTKADRRAHRIETYDSSDDLHFGQWTEEFVRFGRAYSGQLIGVDMVAEPLRSMMADIARRAGVNDRTATWRELLDEAMPPSRNVWEFGRVCEEINGKVKAFLARPLEGDWPYPRIDATYLKVRRGGRIVSFAVIIAIGVNTDG